MGVLGGLIGGLGLFLLAVGMLTDGLRMAAGDALRDLLANWTRTPLRGIGAGALITGIVQSSSAVTVATIGFVNANLLTMHQALGVVYGANIGTTMTGWLVAAVGFKIKVEAFALPIIGVGMLLHLTGTGRRRGALGSAMAGFGLFFIGIDVLRGAFDGLAQGVDLASLGSDNVWGLLLFVAIGTFMTLVTQASAAAIAITLTAATSGVIEVPAAAAMVIGANVGTTSTAVFAAIGATANAKRVACAHVIFNLATGAVALLLLPGLLWAVDNTGRLLQMSAAPAIALALFHTLFNVLGVLLMWPFTARLAAFLQRHFVTVAEDLGKPRYLDATTSRTPMLAKDAMRLELVRVLDMGRQQALESLRNEVDRKHFAGRQAAIESLCDVVDGAVARVERSRLTAEEARDLPDILRVSRRLREVAAAAAQVARSGIDCPQAEGFVSAIGDLLDRWQPEAVLFDSDLGDQARQLKMAYEQVRTAVLQATATGQFQPARSNALLDQLRAAHRMTDQLAKAARQLQHLREGVESHPVDAVTDTGPAIG